MPMPDVLRTSHRGYWPISHVIEASATLLRVPTSWNRSVRVMDGRSALPVDVDAEHTLYVRKDVLDDIVRTDRGIRDVTRYRQAHESLTQLVHGAIRLSRDDLTGLPEPGVGMRPDEVSEALAGGLAQSWALSNVDAVIRRTELATNSPRIFSTRRFDEYPQLTAAARKLVAGVADQAGRPLDATHRDLVSAPESQRFHVIAEWLIKRNLDELIGPHERTAFRDELARVAHYEYAAVARIHAAVEPMRTGKAHERVEKHHEMAARAVLAADQTVIQMNVRVKGKQVGWRDDHPSPQPQPFRDAASAAPSAEQVRAAAVELGVPVDKLRSFLAGTADPSGAARPGTGATAASSESRPSSRERPERGTGPR